MGSVVISVDAELGWGFHDLEDPPTRRIEAGRSGWRTLLEVLETYDVPATWAVVGHLMLDGCDGDHVDHPAIDGWFDRERQEWRHRPDLRFGRDLVEETLEAGPDHEIASHTFSHVQFDDPRLTEAMARAELEAAVEAATDFGIGVESFVFPRNAEGYHHLLAEYGFVSYRSAPTTPTAGVRRYLQKSLDVANPGRVDLVTPTVDEHGLVNIPPSLFLFGFEGMAKMAVTAISGDPVLRQAIHGIDRASREDGIFHLWLHPNNLCSQRDEDRIRSLLAYIAERRDTSALTVETMGDIGRRVRSLGPVTGSY